MDLLVWSILDILLLVPIDFPSTHLEVIPAQRKLSWINLIFPVSVFFFQYLIAILSLLVSWNIPFPRKIRKAPTKLGWEWVQRISHSWTSRMDQREITQRIHQKVKWTQLCHTSIGVVDAKLLNQPAKHFLLKYFKQLQFFCCSRQWI